ncbi:MAG: hypothetical protein ABSD44_06255 [Terracidiphilus sp.]
MAMINFVALMRLQGFHFFENFSSRDFAWLLIGVLLAVAAMWAIKRQRRRWL